MFVGTSIVRLNRLRRKCHTAGTEVTNEVRTKKTWATRIGPPMRGVALSLSLRAQRTSMAMLSTSAKSTELLEPKLQLVAPGPPWVQFGAGVVPLAMHLAVRELPP